jgi:hypothetical protein
MINNLTATSQTRRVYDHRVREQVIRIGIRCLPRRLAGKTKEFPKNATQRLSRTSGASRIGVQRIQRGIAAFLRAMSCP